MELLIFNPPPLRTQILFRFFFVPYAGWTYSWLFVLFNRFQAVWVLKTRALTEQLYVDEVENDEEGIAEMLMDDNAIASVQAVDCHLNVIRFKWKNRIGNKWKIVKKKKKSKTLHG